MRPVPFRQFDAVYQAAVSEVARFCTPEAQQAVAEHCHGWGPGLFDFVAYFRASSVRFHRAYTVIASRGEDQRVCDVGSLWGVFPLALRALGFDVTMTEALRYYGRAFDGLFAAIRARGVRLADYDPFESGQTPAGRFDAVTVMAVLEHYPHSLATFMTNIRSLLGPRACLYVEVPNLAYWPNRMKLLRGQTPLVGIADIYRSKVPFLGHHHEFTLAELHELARLSGLRVTRQDCFGYSDQAGFIRRLIWHPVSTIAQACLPDSREVLAVVCEEASPKATP